MPAATILALDLATTTGWAVGRPGEPIRYGALKLGNIANDQSLRFATFSAWVFDAIEKNGVERVVFEAPRDPRHMTKMNKMGQRVQLTNFSTTRMLLGLCAIAEAEARRAGIKPNEVEAGKVRKHLFSGPAPRGQNIKRAVTARLNMLGFEPQDDNAADAIAIWLYASALLAPGADVATLLPLGVKK